MINIIVFGIYYMGNTNDPMDQEYDNFNDPLDKNYIQSQENIIPIDFEVVARDQSYLTLAKDPDSLRESITNISETYKTFGKQYGIDIKFDIDSVSETFKSIISDSSEKVFGLYLVKAYSKMKLSIFNKILIAVQTLVDRITTKDILESDNVEMSVALLDKLFDLMSKVNKVYEEIKNESADLLLRNLSKEMTLSKDGEASADLNSHEVMEVLRKLRETNIEDKRKDDGDEASPLVPA